MKETAKDKEIEKLKKQVKKLKSEKDALKRDNRSLKGRLSTAKARGDKYHDALKKKEVPNAESDKEVFNFIMNLLDDISTRP